MTFGQKGSKLNSRPVFCSRLYGNQLFLALICRDTSPLDFCIMILLRNDPKGFLLCDPVTSLSNYKQSSDFLRKPQKCNAIFLLVFKTKRKIDLLYYL